MGIYIKSGTQVVTQLPVLLSLLSELSAYHQQQLLK